MFGAPYVVESRKAGIGVECADVQNSLRCLPILDFSDANKHLYHRSTRSASPWLHSKRESVYLKIFMFY